MSSFLNDFVDFASLSMDDSRGLDYVLQRGASHNIIQRLKLGYVPDGYQVDSTLDANHSGKCDDDEKKSEWCDSCRFMKWSKHGNSTKLSDVVVLPITSYSGQIYGFQIRSIKEKNYDTFMIKDRPEPSMFGLYPQIHEIWSKKSAVFVEGPFDMLVLSRFSPIPVLSLNTNSMTSIHYTLSSRFLDTIFLCLDNDEAGKSGARKVIERLSDQISVRRVEFFNANEGVKDLNEFWQKFGDVKFRARFQDRFNQ